MGFIKAFTGALSGTFADQWKDYYMPAAGVSATAAVFEAVPQAQNAGIGQNTKGSNNIITNGSKIVVPEGTALITLQDGQITGLVVEPGGYEYRSDDPNSRSLFAGDGLFASTLSTTWERVKFGGQPASQQLAFYVNLKEIPGLKFGTQETVYWQDSYLQLQAGGMARGTYSLKITDPLLFVKNFVPVKFLQPDAPVFDFADMDNEAGNQLFGEFLNTLSSAIARLSLEAKNSEIDTMNYIQANQTKFANAMNEEVETAFNWKTLRGLDVVSVNVLINYDQKTQEVLEEIRKDDAEIRRAKRMGEAYGNNMAGMMAAASGQAMQAAAGNENGAMMGFMGMGLAQAQGANMLNTVNQMQPAAQPVQPTTDAVVAATPVAPAAESTPTQSPTDKLLDMKRLLDAGAITQEEYDKVKAQVLGL